MARHRGSKGRSPNAVYIVVGLVAIVVIIGLIYGLGPFGANGGDIPPDSNDVNFVAVVPPETGNAGFEPPKKTEIEEVEPNIPPVAVNPPVNIKTDSQAEKLIDEAMSLLSGAPSRIIEARDKLNETLKMPMSPQQLSLVKSQMAKLSEQWLLSKTFYAQDTLCSSYKVQSGDRLEIIGKKYNVPYEFIMEINNIRRPELLLAGARIKVVNGPFHVKVYRSSFTMDVYLQGTYVKSFPVGLGASGRQTPLGLWHIKAGGKIPHALYTDPDSGAVIHPEDPAYPLGSRWMALEGLDDNTKSERGFGIHGTKDPQSIGKASSRGCVRLHNGDVIKVYNMLIPEKSLVKIFE